MSADETFWLNEWGGVGYFAHDDNRSRGVAILFRPDLNIEINQSSLCEEGRFIVLKTSFKGVQLTLGCIYGPNDDSVAPFERFLDESEKLWGEYVVLGGHFNLFLNEDLDKKSGRNSRINHKHCKRLVTQFMSENDLIDIWITLNPNRKQITCLRQTPPSKSRIYFFLTTRSILEGVPHASIVEGYLTDHKMCCLDFNVARTARGRSFWKFNDSLLGDDTFISEGKIKIKEIIRENESELISKTTLLAIVLCVLRGWIIQYASRKKRENEKKFRDLEEDLNDAVNNDLPADVIDAIREKRDGLITMVTKYNMLRCRTNWRQYAEKGTKYFHSLSKRAR